MTRCSSKGDDHPEQGEIGPIGMVLVQQVDQEGLKVRRHVQEWKRSIKSGELGYLLVDEEDDQGGKRREADVDVDGHLQVVGRLQRGWVRGVHRRCGRV